MKAPARRFFGDGDAFLGQNGGEIKTHRTLFRGEQRALLAQKSFSHMLTPRNRTAHVVRLTGRLGRGIESGNACCGCRLLRLFARVVTHHLETSLLHIHGDCPAHVTESKKCYFFRQARSSSSAIFSYRILREFHPVPRYAWNLHATVRYGKLPRQRF